MSETTAGTHRSSDSAGAIYGTIVAMAMIAAGAHGTGLGRLLLVTLATLCVFWIAHVYAAALEHHLRAAQRLDWAAIRRAMAEEWPLVTGPLPCLAVLALGALGLLGETVTIRLALWIGILQLLGWGITFARRQRWSWPTALTAGLVNTACGIAIVVLEVLIH
ncbi:hypothetical protein [Kribbella sp. CA-247076]|uniref:hypothetical protein n=1 Tax=Kribbella sp. CA-247076 TaxID=3239941 RepID=UPI003D8ACB19